MNFNIVEKEQVIVTDELYEQIKEEYISSDLKVTEIRKKHNLTHRDWKNISKQIREELNVKCRPRNAKYYYKLAENRWRVCKWNGTKLVHLGDVWGDESVVQEVVKLCEEASWDIDECKRIVVGVSYDANR